MAAGGGHRAWQLLFLPPSMGVTRLTLEGKVIIGQMDHLCSKPVGSSWIRSGKRQRMSRELRVGTRDGAYGFTRSPVPGSQSPGNQAVLLNGCLWWKS